jgi:thiamine-phosphate pyrophosphorylase
VDGRLYLCAPAVSDAVLRAALRGGVDLLQLRDSTLDDDGVLRESARFMALAAETGARFVLNDRPDLAAACGADGVHLGQDDMTPAAAREIVGPDAIIGRSTHAPEQGAEAAADPDVDYVSIGPVWPTPTKPGRPAAGIEYVRWAAANVDKPWFAIGGVDEATVHEVVAAGASRVVVVRAILDAADPSGAAARLRALVVGAPDAEDPTPRGAGEVPHA